MILFFEEILSTFLHLVLLRNLLALLTGRSEDTKPFRGFPQGRLSGAAVPAAQVFAVQIILEDDHRGHHIDDFAPFFPLQVRVD